MIELSKLKKLVLIAAVTGIAVAAVVITREVKATKNIEC